MIINNQTELCRSQIQEFWYKVHTSLISLQNSQKNHYIEDSAILITE